MNLKYFIYPFFKEGTFSVKLWCSAYLYCTALLNKVWTQVLRIDDGCSCLEKQLKKVLKCLKYLVYWKTKYWKCLVCEKDAKANINLVDCVNFTTCLDTEVDLSILKIKQWGCGWIFKRSFEGWIASPLVIKGLVQLGKKWVIFYLHLALRITCRRVSPWNWYINFYTSFINGYLFFRCLEKVFEENKKRNENKKGKL